MGCVLAAGPLRGAVGPTAAERPDEQEEGVGPQEENGGQEDTTPPRLPHLLLRPGSNLLRPPSPGTRFIQWRLEEDSGQALLLLLAQAGHWAIKWIVTSTKPELVGGGREAKLFTMNPQHMVSRCA